MPTGISREGRKEPNDKIVIFPVKHKLKSLLITQRDLAEERLLWIEFSEAAERLKLKREWIREMLRYKVPIEPGLRKAKLIRKARRVGRNMRLEYDCLQVG